MERQRAPIIALHPITPADITHIHRGLSHPEVIRYYAVRFMTLEAIGADGLVRHHRARRHGEVVGDPVDGGQ
ncbi:MAG: hypothetical protein JNL05_08205 [Flavobacteriales bacterium]|nr:hypothetical protein [Flavobacteriales bacterium]